MFPQSQPPLPPNILLDLHAHRYVGTVCPRGRIPRNLSVNGTNARAASIARVCACTYLPSQVVIIRQSNNQMPVTPVQQCAPSVASISRTMEQQPAPVIPSQIPEMRPLTRSLPPASDTQLFPTALASTDTQPSMCVGTTV